MKGFYRPENDVTEVMSQPLGQAAAATFGEMLKSLYESRPSESDAEENVAQAAVAAASRPASPSPGSTLRIHACLDMARLLVGEAPGEACAWLHRALDALAQDDRFDCRTTEALLAQVEGMALALPDHCELATVYCRMAEAALANCQPQDAVGYAERAVTLAHGLQRPLEEGVSLRVLGQARLASGQNGPALAAFAHSLALLRDRHPDEAACTRRAWADGAGSNRPDPSGFARPGATLGHKLAGCERQLSEPIP